MRWMGAMRKWADMHGISRIRGHECLLSIPVDRFQTPEAEALSYRSTSPGKIAFTRDAGNAIPSRQISQNLKGRKGDVRRWGDPPGHSEGM